MAFAGNKSVVRQSKFRHIYAEYSQNKYDDVKSPAKTSLEGCFSLAASESYIAVPSPMGGANNAALMFIPVDNTQINRLQLSNIYAFHNGCGITDFEFDPFRSNRVATSGEDSVLKLWDIPSSNPEMESDGFGNIIKDPSIVLENATKKITCLKFNPCVDGCLATASQDGVVMVWDAQSKRHVTRVDCKDVAQSIDWDFYGNTLCSMFKDKVLRLVDTRQNRIVSQANASAGHKGIKPARAIWLSQRKQQTDSGKYILTTGFSNHAKREMFLWDSRKMEEPAWKTTIDDNSGVIYPYFDECTGLVFLVGRGDGNIRFYEFADSSMYYLNDHRSSTPQRGFAMFPKRVMDQDKNEIARFLKLESNAIQTLSFFVPRRADVGSSDLYLDYPAGVPAFDSVGSWISRNDEVSPVLTGTSTRSRNGTPGIRPSIPIPTVAIVTPTEPTAVMPGYSEQEYNEIKYQLNESNKVVEEQRAKIQRLEAIVQSINDHPVKSPPPKRASPQLVTQIEDLQAEVDLLKEKVIKLMNENARLRMNFSVRTSAPAVVTALVTPMTPIPTPPPIQPIGRSPPIRTPSSF